MSALLWSSKWVRRAAIAAAILALGVGGLWWKQDDLRILFHVHLDARVLPPFDASKAANLTRERREELERELFTELPMWNTQSRRYVEPNGRKEREQRWQQMADEGYELAHLVLQVFQPSRVSVHDPRPTLKRLETLAQQGDAGAMCLIVRVINQLPYDAIKGSKRLLKSQNYWMQKGADSGHPQCLTDLGRRLIGAADGWPHDPLQGREMLFKAMRQGYLSGAGSFWLEYKRIGLDDASNRRLVYCWGYQLEIIEFPKACESLSYYIDYLALSEKQESLKRELEQLRQWQPALEECIQLSQGK